MVEIFESYDRQARLPKAKDIKETRGQTKHRKPVVTASPPQPNLHGLESRWRTRNPEPEKVHVIKACLTVDCLV